MSVVWSYGVCGVLVCVGGSDGSKEKLFFLETSVVNMSNNVYERLFVGLCAIVP